MSEAIYRLKIAEMEAEVDRLETVIKFALARCYEDNYLMVLHWDAHDLLKKALQPPKEGSSDE